MTELRLRGRLVTLRPVREDEFDALAAVRQDPSMPPFDADRFRARVAASGTFFQGELLLAIEAGGRLVGEVQGRQPENGLPPGVYEVGIELFDEADRGRGLGREATALMTSHLFGALGAGRVQATTEVGNAAMRRVLEFVGFRFEGVLRGFWPNADGPRIDYAMYGITKDDWGLSPKR